MKLPQVCRSTMILHAMGLVALGVVVASCGGGGGSAANQTCTEADYTPNYVSTLEGACISACSANLYRWTTLPIKVYRVSPLSWTTTASAAYSNALNRWSAAVGGSLSFVEVSTAEAADITVSFVTASTVATNAVGLTTLTTQGSSMRKAEIQVATLNFGTGTPRSLADLSSTTTHEVGHALGIAGHSPSISDLMYRTISDSNGTRPGSPSPSDVNVLLTAYCGGFGRSAPVPSLVPIRTETLICPQ